MSPFVNSTCCNNFDNLTTSVNEDIWNVNTQDSVIRIPDQHLCKRFRHKLNIIKEYLLHIMSRSQSNLLLLTVTEYRKDQQNWKVIRQLNCCQYYLIWYTEFKVNTQEILLGYIVVN